MISAVTDAGVGCKVVNHVVNIPAIDLVVIAPVLDSPTDPNTCAVCTRLRD